MSISFQTTSTTAKQTIRIQKNEKIQLRSMSDISALATAMECYPHDPQIRSLTSFFIEHSDSGDQSNQMKTRYTETVPI